MAEIQRYGRPDERTVGDIGDIYTNTNTNEQFKCVDTYEIHLHERTITYYVWVPIREDTGSGSGSGSTGGSGGTAPSASEKDVNFYDYDGTILHSYTVEEAQALSELPPLPTREGLICQGWNWTLENIKAYGRAVNVGATYTTDDGTTRLYITLQEGRTSPMLGVCPNGTVTVDWGDGTEPDVLTGTSTTTVKWTPNHEYSKPGDYVIRLSSTGTMGFYGGSTDSYILRHNSGNNSSNRAYKAALRKIEIGSNMTFTGRYVFNECYSLTSVTIPSGVTSIGPQLFKQCYSLASIVIPYGVTTIDQQAFTDCYSLAVVAIPDSVMSIGNNVFYSCHSLTSVTIPYGVTTIGNQAFYNCCALTSITIPDSVTTIFSQAFYNCYAFTSITIPDSVTTIGSMAFYSCYSLTSINIPDSIITIGDSAFSNCKSLASVTIPYGITSIGASLFNACHSLASVTIPDSVTSIGNQAFYNCYPLASVTIPGSLTSIGNSAFNNCCSVRFYDFSKHTTVPTLSSTNAFTGIPSDCEIRVPAALYDEWIAATNWSTYASQIVAV